MFNIIFILFQKEPTAEEMQDFVNKLQLLSKNIQDNAGAMQNGEYSDEQAESILNNTTKVLEELKAFATKFEGNPQFAVIGESVAKLEGLLKDIKK